jgi:hypothetical protein
MAKQITFKDIARTMVAPPRQPRDNIGADRARSNGALGGINGTRGTAPR